jgi:hypothetical protein
MQIQDYDPSNPNQTGCILGMPNDVYHANPAISHSKLSDFITRPALYKGKYIDKVIPNGNSDALRLGSAIHALILEGPEVFDGEFVVFDTELSFRGGAAKLASAHALNEALIDPLSAVEVERIACGNKDDILAAFEELPGRARITPDEMTLIEQCYDSVMSVELCKELLGAGCPEVVFRSEETMHGYPVQCRADWLNVDPGLSKRACELLNADGFNYEEGMPYGVDLKTIQSLLTWDADFRKRKYYRAWPFYAKTMELSVGQNIVKEWFWIVVEKEYPFFAIARPPEPECWDVGIDEISWGMPELGECLKTGDWRDHGVRKVRRQGLPDYMLINTGRPRIGVS